MPVPSQVSVYMWPDDDFFGWLEYVINSLDSSIDGEHAILRLNSDTSG